MTVSQGRLPILNYHALEHSGSPISIDPEWFVDTISQLVEAGFVGVDLTAWVACGRPPIDRGFAVTFDDGLRSMLAGVSILERYGVPATIFLVTDHVGRDNDWPGQPVGIPRQATLDWSEIADLSRRGFRFAAHTRSHPGLDLLGPEAISREMSGSREAIETHLNQACPLFAYPYGAIGQDARDRAEWHFDAAFGTRLAAASVGDDGFDLPRIDAYYLRNQRAVDRLIANRMKPWLSVRRGLRAVRRAAVALTP
jgi:peptidoglycan/xylan/chitin deacetylase (PgdA/CDA1 family)